MNERKRADLKSINEIPEDLVLFNRERYRNELAQGIYQLMVTQGVTRTELARLLNVGKARISHILSGSKNLQADTLADILLVLWRTPHLVMATDFDEIRFAVDEGDSSTITATAMQKNEGITSRRR